MSAVDFHKLGKGVDFLAGHALAARNLHALDQGRSGKKLEAGAAHNFGNVHKFKAKAGIGLVHAVAGHGLVPGHARERQRNILAHDVLEHAGHKAFSHAHDRFLVRKAHFDVHLGELRLAVGSQVFVAEAAHDLEVTIHTGHHEQLLEQLRRLRQGVEFPGIQTAGHQKVTRPFGRGLGEDGGFHLHKAVVVQIAAHALGHLVTQAQIGLHARAAQVKVAPGQAQVFTGVAAVFNGERRGFGGIEQLPFRGHHFDLPRHHIGIDHALRAWTHPALDGEHVFRTQDVRIFVRLGGRVRAEDHLGKAHAVTQIHKDKAAMVAPVLYPAHDADILPVIGKGQFTAIVGAMPLAKVGDVLLMLLLHVLALRGRLFRHLAFLSHVSWFPFAKSVVLQTAERLSALRFPDFL